MAHNFDQCLKWVLVDEGGNDDDPRDHGGRTSRGITQREYDSWCRSKGKRKGDVWQASDADIKTIYHDQYWNPYCDSLSSGIDYLFFDISVNSGRTAAVRNFQKTLGVRVDGMMGEVTKQALKEVNPETFIRKAMKVRRDYYKSLAQFSIYGKGWMSRADHLEKGALSLVKRNYIRPSEDEPSAKARPEDRDTPMVNPTGASTVAAGSGGAMSIMDQAKDTLAPYADTIRYIQYFLLGLAVVGLSFAVYGFWRRNKVDSAM